MQLGKPIGTKQARRLHAARLRSALRLAIGIVVAVAGTPNVGLAMLFRPPPDYRLWDTWMYVAGDEFHLFFSQGPAGGRHSSVGHAVSSDLIHWKSLGPVVQRGPKAWERFPRFASGTVIRHGDKHLMFQAGVGRDRGMAVMTSTDLHHWTKHPDDPVFTVVPPYHDRMGDPFVFPVIDGFEAVCKAYLPGGIPCVGRIYSKDLMHWEPRPPIATPKLSQCEVPEYFAMGGKHYLTFSACGGRPGCIKSDLVVDTKSRRDTAGTYYLVADAREGPYVMPQDPLLVGSGNGRIDNYVARSFEFNGQRLLYYHNVGLRPGGCDPVLSRAALGAFKILRQRTDGTLWAEYWSGLEGLETGVLVDKFTGDTQPPTGWALKPGVLVGQPSRSISPYWLATGISDFHLTCAVTVEEASRAGVIVRYDEESKRGTTLVLNAKTGDIEIAQNKTERTKLLDTVRGDIQPRRQYQIRVFARAEFVDWYVNDRLIFSTAINDVPLAGRIGFTVNGAAASFSHLRVASLEELP